jgi:hypothetical protein
MIKRFSSESSLAIKILRGLRRISLPEFQDERQITLLSTQQSYTDAVIGIKFYIISWCTLSDVLAGFVNTVFDLGIDKKDINLTMVLRNKHVSKSQLPYILSKYNSKIRYSHFSKTRNDIVHRGVLDDSELAAIKRHIHRVGLLELFGDPSVAVEQSQIAANLREYLLKKQVELTTHLSDTVAMLEEMIEHCSDVFDDIVERHA